MKQHVLLTGCQELNILLPAGPVSSHCLARVPSFYLPYLLHCNNDLYILGQSLNVMCEQSVIRVPRICKEPLRPCFCNKVFVLHFIKVFIHTEVQKWHRNTCTYTAYTDCKHYVTQYSHFAVYMFDVMCWTCRVCHCEQKILCPIPWKCFDLDMTWSQSQVYHLFSKKLPYHTHITQNILV